MGRGGSRPGRECCFSSAQDSCASTRDPLEDPNHEEHPDIDEDSDPGKLSDEDSDPGKLSDEDSDPGKHSEEPAEYPERHPMQDSV